MYVIVSSILTTFFLDCVLKLLGENRCLSLWNLKGLRRLGSDVVSGKRVVVKFHHHMLKSILFTMASLGTVVRKHC